MGGTKRRSLTLAARITLLCVALSAAVAALLTWVGQRGVSPGRATGYALLTLGAATLVSALAARRIIRPARQLIAVTDEILETNDLTRALDTSADDELGHLARSFSRMVDALRDALATLHSASFLLVVAAEQLQTSTEKEREFLAHQASALQQTQRTAQQIKESSAIAAEKAQLVVRAAESADALGRSGEGAVDESISGLAAIQAKTGDLGARIRSLSDDARRIGSITEAVKDLADQSNMLALNAAIEAVRSGEHGKGFAVVAREIRSLADQSISATRRVSEILSTVTGSIASAVTMSEQGARSVDEGVLRVRQSGDDLRGLLAIAQRNVDSARQIAGAVQQQDAGIQQIFVGITDQLSMMQLTRARIESASAASATVREQAERVSDLLSKYRI